MNLVPRLKGLARSVANVHRPGPKPDIFLFATPRGGSTWVMEIIASQPGMKFYDEPLSPRRESVAMSGVIPDWSILMHDSGDRARVIGFLQALQGGRYGFMNPPPFRRNHRVLTNRIVFKLHEIEHLMDDVERECGGQIVCLLRHPIATSVSRHQLPRLEMLLTCSYHAAVLDDSQRHAEVRDLARRGDFFQRAIISWCLENLVILRQPRSSWFYVTYEELVLNPERSCDLLLDRLGFDDRTAMLEAFERPAANITMSQEQTLAALRSRDARHRRVRLVSKWRDETTEQQRVQAAEILDLFRLDAYDARELLPSDRYLHFPDTKAILERDARDSGAPG